MNKILKKFSDKGGMFLINEHLFLDKLHKIKVFIFDWDGVFTNGLKDADLQSQFNESDSVGLNLLRFSYFLKYHHTPIIAFISGEKNKPAFFLAQREHIHYHYFKIPHKIKAFEHLCETLNIKENETCFVFDDILDLSIAEKCGLRIYIQKSSAVLFNEYVIAKHLADYVSFSTGATNAVREVSELIIGSYDNFEETISNRIQFSPNYQSYLNEKRAIKTQNFSFINHQIILAENI